MFALPAAHGSVGRRARSAAAVLGLITASAVIVHLSGGMVEAHFHIVERLRVATPLVTCSVGLASGDFQEGWAELVQRADQALHLAKAEGRNRYVAA